jgi:hypothetical protein
MHAGFESRKFSLNALAKSGPEFFSAGDGNQLTEMRISRHNVLRMLIRIEERGDDWATEAVYMNLLEE